MVQTEASLYEIGNAAKHVGEYGKVVGENFVTEFAMGVYFIF